VFRVDILVLSCQLRLLSQKGGVIGLFFGWLAGWEKKTISLLIHISGITNDHRLRRFYLCNNIYP